jgi:hypothetical protein
MKCWDASRQMTEAEREGRQMTVVGVTGAGCSLLREHEEVKENLTLNFWLRTTIPTSYLSPNPR